MQGQRGARNTCIGCLRESGLRGVPIWKFRVCGGPSPRPLSGTPCIKAHLFYRRSIASNRLFVPFQQHLRTREKPHFQVSPAVTHLSYRASTTFIPHLVDRKPCLHLALLPPVKAKPSGVKLLTGSVKNGNYGQSCPFLRTSDLVSSNLLYPKEDRATSELLYICKACHAVSKHDSACTYRAQLGATVADTAGVTTDVANDPTVGAPFPNHPVSVPSVEIS